MSSGTLCPCLLALQLLLHVISMPAQIGVLPLCILETFLGRLVLLGPHPLAHPQPRTLLLCCGLQDQSPSQSLRKCARCHRGDQECCCEGAGGIKSRTEDWGGLWGQKFPGWVPTRIILALQQLLKQNYSWFIKEPGLNKDDSISLVFGNVSH